MCLTTNTWTAVGTGSGSGDVVGPASSTDNAVARFDSTTGKLLQNSVVTIDDTGNASGIISETPSANFQFTMNSVGAVKFINSGAVVNSLVVSAGLTGIGLTPASGKLDVLGDAGATIVNIAGTAPAAVGGSSNGTAAGSMMVAVGATGGETSSTTANTIGGAGGAITVTGGTGGAQSGAASGTSRGGNGGTLTYSGGAGGNATAVSGTVKGGAGGSTNFNGGAGGTSATGIAGAGGAGALTAGTGGITTAAAASGAGGSYTIAGGTGGANSNAAGTAGGGGSVTIDAGAAGAASGGATTGNNGSITIGGTNAVSTILSRSGGSTTIQSSAITFNHANYQSCTALTTSSGGLVTCTVSDVLVKHDMNPFSGGLDAIRKITPQTFRFQNSTQYGDGGQLHLGFVAQNLQKANPLFASKTGNGLLQPEGLAIQAATVSAIQELDAKITTLTKIIEDQQKQIDKLRKP